MLLSKSLVISLVVLALPQTAIVAEAESALSAKQEATIVSSLRAQLKSDPVGTTYDVIVRLTDIGRVPRELLRSGAGPGSLTSHHSLLGRALRASALDAQANFEIQLATLPGSVTTIESYWITNALRLRADRVALEMLAEREDVSFIAPNATIELLQPVAIADAVESASGLAANIQSIGTRALWARGLTGRGRLVASIDTGVEGIHPALKSSWRGRWGDTSAAWFDPYGGTAPADNNGHGTHVMGIMVGRDDADTIGVAPDAEWICAAVIDRGSSLSATFADILRSLQWIVDPDGDPETVSDVPDAVCNSWGVSQDIIGPCDDLFFDAIDNVEALGVVCVFAAGNEGPYSMSMRNPADRATSPTASFSVGAVDATQASLPIPGFSSRGPSACDGISPKPELVAPGVAIRSAYKGQIYKSINGTSMAAPHVAAAIALLRQYNPDLSAEEIKTALLSTARDVGIAGEDNASGRGMIDLEAALAAVRPPAIPVVAAQITNAPGGSDGLIALGEEAAVVAQVSVDNFATSNVALEFSSLTDGITVLQRSSYLGEVAAGSVADNAAAPFVFRVSPDFVAGKSARFELRLSGDARLLSWRDTLEIMCGLPNGATVVPVSNGPCSFTLSNFGQLGLAPGSSLNAGGTGWTSSFFPGSILHEGALLVCSQDGWADASRRSDGSSTFDFAPGPAEGADALAFDDSRAALPNHVNVSQQVLQVVSTGEYEFTTIAWTIRVAGVHAVDDLRVGWLWDIDLDVGNGVLETAHIDPDYGGIYHTTSGTAAVAGYASLSGTLVGRGFFANSPQGKSAPSLTQKRDAMNAVGPLPGAGDLFEIVGTAPVDMGTGDSVTVVLAMITARDADAFTAAALDARNRWLAIAGVGDDQGSLRPPSTFQLDQNYPNPFNAATTIPLSLSGGQVRHVRLDIVDILGRRVRTVVDDDLEPGNHAFVWDGTSDAGQPLASGVYFSRLFIAGQGKDVRAMVLLK